VPSGFSFLTAGYLVTGLDAHYLIVSRSHHELTVPVTAKLSRKFYKTFGDDITNELVEWLNQVDASYLAEFREFNELHYQRFDARLEQRLADVRADLMKWMFIFWAGTVIPLGGLILALYRAP
jgi:hypothetical protein